MDVRFDEIIQQAASDSSCPAEIHQLLTEGVQLPAEFKQKQHSRPSWFDKHMYIKGQACFRDNTLSLVVLHLIGLLNILHVPSILSVLKLTDQSSTRWRSFNRYLETLRMLISWYNGDIFDVCSDAGRRIQTVVNRHNVAFKRHRSSTPSQLDMVLTQWAFCAHFLLHPDRLTGLMMTDGDLSGLIHFWRCVGCRLGIPDRLNLCAGSVSECERRCRWLLSHVIAPSILLHTDCRSSFTGSSSSDCSVAGVSCRVRLCAHAMTHSMLSGVALIVPCCNQLAMRLRSLRLVFGDSAALCRAGAQLPLYPRAVHALLGCYCRVARHSGVLGYLARAMSRALLLFAVNCCTHVPAVPWLNWRVQCLLSASSCRVKGLILTMCQCLPSNRRNVKLSSANHKQITSHSSAALWQLQVCNDIRRKK